MLEYIIIGFLIITFVLPVFLGLTIPKEDY